jgi:hypothetical protein
MPELGYSLALAQNVHWGFILSATFPTGGVIAEPQYL